MLTPILLTLVALSCLLFAGSAGDKDRSVSGTRVRVRCSAPVVTLPN